MISLQKNVIIVAIAIIVVIVAVGAFAISRSPQSAYFATTSSRPQQYPSNQTSTASSAPYNSSSQPTSSAAPGTTRRYAVNVAYNPTVGNYLVNSSGWTLYIYTKDTPYSGSSACYGGCVQAWPVFYAANLTVAPGLNASAFGVITRTNGTKQDTYLGLPLYYYEFDTKAGVINGQNVFGFKVATVSNSSS